MNSKVRTIAGTLLTMVFLMIGSGSFLRVEAQPSGYCYPGDGSYDYTCYASDDYIYYEYYYNPHIKQIRIYNEAEQPVLWERSQPLEATDDGCYIFDEMNYEGEGLLFPGNTYTVEMVVTYRYYWYYTVDYPYCDRYYTSSYDNNYWATHRIFLDWGMDASFEETGGGGAPSDWINGGVESDYKTFWSEFPWYNGSSTYKDFCNNEFVHQHTITVPNEQEVGKTRMRFMAQTYYYFNWESANYADISNPCVSGYRYDNTANPYGYDYGATIDLVVEFGLPIQATFPSNKEPDNILLAGKLYNGETRTVDGEEVEFKQPMLEMRAPQPEGSKARFVIRGPLPAKDELYVGLDEDTGSQFIDISGETSGQVLFEINNSEVGEYSPSGEGEFISYNGGTYEVFVELFKPGEPLVAGSGQSVSYPFNVAWDDDMAAIQIISPETSGAPRFVDYIRGLPISVSVQYQNTGLNTVYQFRANADIYASDGSLVESFTELYDVQDGKPAIPSLEKITIDFGNFETEVVDTYTFITSVELLSAEDQEEYNDRLPRIDEEDYNFSIQDEIEAAVLEPILPAENGIVSVSRPFRPAAIFTNNGISDISNATVSYTISNNSEVVVAQGVQEVEEIPSGQYNRKAVYFEPVDVSQSGSYTMEFRIDANGDITDAGDAPNTDLQSRIEQRNAYVYNFNVTQGLSGTFTIGEGEDYLTLGEAVNDLYKEGMNGSIIFEIVATELHEGYGFAPYIGVSDPAIDLKTEIIGLGWDEENNQYNTLTIRPAPERAVERGGSTIYLHTMSGVGIEFGQGITNASPNAVVRDRINAEYFNRYANSPGYIIFDGGENKSLRFELICEGSGQLGVPFMLQRGSTNIQLKNLLITNGSPEVANSTWLPMSRFNLNEGFLFQSEIQGTQSGELSFSAGIANRSTLLDRLFATFDEEGNIIDDDDPEGEVVRLNVDTLSNSNNRFSNNEIDGFGYGIVTIGLGVLFDAGRAEYEEYYNKNNIIENNIISNVARAGIFAGFEDGLEIRSNVIQGVSGESNDFSGQFAGDAAGIILGGDSYAQFLTYNNTNVNISQNTINDVSGAESAKGIVVEQVENRYSDPNGGTFNYPMVSNINIVSNAIWRINAENSNTDRLGIHVFTERAREIDDFSDKFVSTKFPTFRIEDILIANNTVMIGEDGIANNGLTIGIGLQQTTNAVLKNNAIAITDSDLNGDISSLVFLQGTMPDEGSLVSDYNAYYKGESGADVFRFIQSYSLFNDFDNTEETVITNEGFSGEYSELTQWQMWTGADYHSAIGTDFTQNIIETGDIPRRLAIVSPSPYSVLNNRGERLEEVQFDINGRARGAADERYDIGAIEFDGKMYRRDVEAMLLTDPGVYRATAPATFDDAEYIMTDNEVEISAIIRNNSSATLTSVPVYLEITGPSGFNFTSETTVSIDATESQEITFPETFMPQTFAELSMQPDRAIFTGMEHNVSPIYHIDVRVDFDENNTNNIISRDQRYYVQRSPLELTVSNSSYEPETVQTTDELAVRLNSQAVYDALEQMGWKYEVAWNDNNIDEDRFDYNIFNRSGWYDRNVDYSIFRTLIWTDGNDKPLPRSERAGLYDFITNSNSTVKKNLLIGSQEIVELNENLDPDFNFIEEGLRASTFYPYSPLINETYAGHSVIGKDIARDIEFEIVSTGVENDADPYPALLSINNEGSGTAKTAFVYEDVKNPNTGEIDPERPESARIMGIAVSSFDNNVITLGVDWRHFGDLHSIFSASFDYIQRNGGIVIPIELLDFTADHVGNRVDLTWSTASEKNSSRFEVEKAYVTETGRSVFSVIDEIQAAGNSGVTKHYGPVSDYDVKPNNSYIYRLKMYDLDGEFEYSNEKIVSIEGTEGFTIDGIFPNPVSDVSTLSYSLANAGNVQIKLYDMTGRVVAELINEYQNPGSYAAVIDTSELTSGIYRLVLTVDGRILTTNVNVVK